MPFSEQFLHLLARVTGGMTSNLYLVVCARVKKFYSKVLTKLQEVRVCRWPHLEAYLMWIGQCGSPQPV